MDPLDGGSGWNRNSEHGAPLEAGRDRRDRVDVEDEAHSTFKGVLSSPDVHVIAILLTVVLVVVLALVVSFLWFSNEGAKADR